MTILDSFSRESFAVKVALSGEINPPGWTRGPFGLFFDLKLERWILTQKVFQHHFLSIEPACQAVLELETLPIDWERLPGDCPREVLLVLRKFAEPEPKPDFTSLGRRLQEFL